MPSIKMSKAEAEDALYSYPVLSTSSEKLGRWTDVVSTILEFPDAKAYELVHYEGRTENCDVDRFCDDVVTLEEVEAYEKTVTAYRRVVGPT